MLRLICRTQSIVSVSEHAANKDSPKSAAAAKIEEKGTPAKSIKARRRKKVSSDPTKGVVQTTRARGR